MSPKLFEIDSGGRLTLSPNAYMIEETKDIIDKYDLDAEPYLAYCHMMSAIDSPIRNLPEEERREAAIIEVHTNIGVFDEDDPLLERCVERLKSLYSTPIIRLFEGLSEEIDNVLYYLKTTPISSDDISARTSIIEKAGKLATSIAAARKQAEEEFKLNTRGNQSTGTIR